MDDILVPELSGALLYLVGVVLFVAWLLTRKHRP